MNKVVLLLKIFSERVFTYKIPFSCLRTKEIIDPLKVSNSIATDKGIEVVVLSSNSSMCLIFEASQTIKISLEKELGFEVEEQITTKNIGGK